MATPEPGKPVTTARFDLAQLSAGLARPCVGGRDGTTELVSYGAPRACLIRIVHPETGIEQPAGAIGEIWVHGDNVAQGYWRKPEQSARTFGERITTRQPEHRRHPGYAPETWESSPMASCTSWAVSKTC